MMAQRRTHAAPRWGGRTDGTRSQWSSAAGLRFAVAWLGICAASCAMALVTAMWAGA